MVAETDSQFTPAEPAGNKIQKALSLYNDGKVEESHAICDEILKDNKDDTDAIYLIALISIQIEGFMNASNLLLHAISLDDKNPDYYFALGYCLEKILWEEQSIQAYQKCIIAHPKYHEAYSNLGLILTKADDLDSATKCFQKAIELKPDLCEAYIGLALCLKKMNHHDDAASAIEIASDYMPSLKERGSSAKEIINNLENDPPELIYGPPLSTLGNKDQPEGKKPSRNKKKPKIRILQHLAMSGGSLISRCLGSMDNISIFNNIHPKGANIPDGHAVNIFSQASNWYHLFDKEEIASMEGQNMDFISAVKLIHKKVHERDDIMILRDWSHLDFLGVPFIDETSNKFTTAELLKNDFEVLQCTTTCHPIDNWISTSAIGILKDKLSFNEFLEKYHNFAKEAKKTNFLKYEDFTENPDDILIKICEVLEIPFDNEYRDRWRFLTRIPPEIIDDVELIVPLDNKNINSEIIENAEANFDYWPSLELLGYEHKQ